MKAGVLKLGENEHTTASELDGGQFCSSIPRLMPLLGADTLKRAYVPPVFW